MQPHRPEAAWALSPEAVLTALQAGATGLTASEAEARLAEHGRNELPHKRGLGWLRMLGGQFKSPVLVILMIAGVITLVLSDWKDSIAIFLAVLVNVSLSLFQEAKAENTLALLQSYVKENAKVLRDGKPQVIESALLVPGDVVRLTAGDRVPADGRIIETNDLEVDEAILTGESLSVSKDVEAVAENAPLGDRTSMAWSGTTVLQGSGLLLVVHTGTETEIGRIATLVASARQESTPLQKALLGFTYRATLVLAVLTGVLFAYGVYVGKSPLDMFLISVATAVAAVPEGLPLALTVILAIGVQRLAGRKGVIRKLLAAETLGSTTLILTDKTGTLTEARMELEGVLPLTETLSQERLLEFAVSHVDVTIENPLDAPADWRLGGRPVEIALAKGSARFGVHAPKVQELYTVMERLPFNSSNKFSASTVRSAGGDYVVLLGAPEALLARSGATPAEKKEIMDMVDKLAFEGARVLAVASHKILAPEKTLSVHVGENKARMLGLLAFRDPIRTSVKDAIRRIGEAGVRTVIVTGDHAGTAATVAREVGLVTGELDALTGSEIDALSDAELKVRLKTVQVIARTTPEHKLRIARAYKELGEIVAMTGDGVNDAPALREADIGVSLGTGSDVAKAAADLVILDDNFETIVAAVEEGRNILQNVRKVIAYVLSNSFDGLLLIGGSLAFGIPLPLTTLQILWVNLFTDSFPAMALAFERNHGDMGRGPIRIGKTIFDQELRFLILIVGTATSVMLLGMYVILLNIGYDPALVRTFIFASFGIYTLFLVFSVRSLRQSIFSFPLLGNRYLVAGTGVGFFMMVSAIYLPALQDIFQTVPLSPIWVAGVIVFGIVSVAGVEVGKWRYRRHLAA